MRILHLLVAVACSQRLDPRIDLSVHASGKFTIAHDGMPWLEGLEIEVAGLSLVAGSLQQVGTPTSGSGVDPLGSFTATQLSWAATGSVDVLMETIFRQYPADPGMIVFEQKFPQKLGNDTSVIAPVDTHGHTGAITSRARSRTVFPSFSRAVGNSLDCFAYHGIFPSATKCTVGSYAESHQGGAPLAIYDSKNASLPMVIFSPLNFPKAHHMATSTTWFGAGVKATVTEIPAGWSQLFLLSAGVGINDGFMAWGDRMLKYTGKPRADMYRDQTHSTIGFWTDNGGYYHYATGDKKYGSTYEEVLPKVKAYHDSIGVPFGHWQFDSWFYPKDGGVNHGGGGGAVTNWTADPKIFPSGMAAIGKKLGLPIVMHNRQWSVRSDYIKHEPFEWYRSEKAAVPADPIAFFAWFFTQQQGWGLSMYEQDWMCTEYDEVAALQTNISLADMWLEGMADGAAGSGRTVQYCMPYPNDVLAGSKHAAVTNARATGDYFHALDQWAVGVTSLFYWAIGILPFKDGFYSSSNKQVGGQTVGPETHPDREALMATLSCAMVGPMDGIGLLNASRVMTSCRKDGLVLKPDRPIATSDACFLDADPTCKIYHTYTDVPLVGGSIATSYRAHYLFSNELTPITAGMLYHPSPATRRFWYNWYTGDSGLFASSTNVAEGYEGHVYAMVLPKTDNNWVLLGEVGKYVPLSRRRVTGVGLNGGGIYANVVGVAGEDVTVCALRCSKDCDSGDSPLLDKVCHAVHFIGDEHAVRVNFDPPSRHAHA